MRDLRVAASAWWSFRGSGFFTMAFLAARMVVVPLGGLDPWFRSLTGSVLSLGCGHGLAERYLALLASDVTVTGLELDEHRVALAARTEYRCPRVQVRNQDVMTLSEAAAYDAAIAIDVFHHVPVSKHVELAAALFRSLGPGGQCLVKDIATTPAWKHSWNRLHDRLVTGQWIDAARAPEDMAATFIGEGFDLAGVQRYGRFGPYPHYLIALTKPSR